MREGCISIQEATEPQTGNISKAVIHASLNAWCWVPAESNHVYRTVERQRMILENIGLPDLMLSHFELIFVVMDHLDVSVLVCQGSTWNRGDYLSYVKSDRCLYRVSDKDIQKVLVNGVQTQTAYMLVYEVEGMRNHKPLHPYLDNSDTSFDGSKLSTTLKSPYHCKVYNGNPTS